MADEAITDEWLRDAAACRRHTHINVDVLAAELLAARAALAAADLMMTALDGAGAQDEGNVYEVRADRWERIEETLRRYRAARGAR